MADGIIPRVSFLLACVKYRRLFLYRNLFFSHFSFRFYDLRGFYKGEGIEAPFPLNEKMNREGVIPMSIPLSKEDEAIAMFDSFCKTVIMNEARRHWRRVLARNAHIRLVPNIDSIAAITQKMNVVETYTILYGEVRADFQCLALYRAVNYLKPNEKAVILLKFWGGYTDMEIAAWLRVTDRTVRNLKKRAYKHISAALTKEE